MRIKFLPSLKSTQSPDKIFTPRNQAITENINITQRILHYFSLS